MSETTGPADQLPILPEIRPIDPLVQCGVLYLGTAPASAGFHALDSIQEPFSHRYPVDGTNTVRGIDAILSVYDNGIQLAFTRQPHSVMFFPIASLIYCASLRFSVVANDQTKSSTNIDWRFMPIDALSYTEDKHPPLFCAVVKRTQVLPGDECHCFITKSVDAALALVRTISQVYETIQSGIPCVKSPIFYQLDRFGRKLSETTGVIYLSPANDDDFQSNRTNPPRLIDDSTVQNYLLDPAFDGYYYRTDASLIEQWQLWDDNDSFGSRPHPPASPFGLHEGLYHDDTTQEVQRHLRRMEEEEHSCSCSCSNKSSSSACSTTTTTDYSQRKNRHRHCEKGMLTDEVDLYDESLTNLHTSTFEPILTRNHRTMKETRHKPIIIEKVVPKPFSSIPILHPKLPSQPLNSSDSLQDTNSNYVTSADTASFSYTINERGEKITSAGNRIVFMDVVRPTLKENPTETPVYVPTKPRSRSQRQRAPKQIPVVNLQSVEKLFRETRKPQIKRRATINNHRHSNEYLDETDELTTVDMLEILDGFYEDRHGHKTKITNDEAQYLIDHINTSEKKQSRKNNVLISTDSTKNESRHRHSRPVFTIAPSVHYGERPVVTSLTQSQMSSTGKKQSPTMPVLTDDQLNEYVAHIYGTPASIHSTSSSNNRQESKSSNNKPIVDASYLSALRYMHSSLNSAYLQQYHSAY